VRTITVSTGVFARIWAAREAGEETEDAILDRLLPGQVQAEGDNKGRAQELLTGAPEGFLDRRYGVLFPEDHEIFRTYLGRDYRARATGGRWMLAHSGQECGSLNELSRAIGTKGENAWVNWFYLTSYGASKPISEMRDQNKIRRRRNWVEELGIPA
jgi:hypothetical protein